MASAIGIDPAGVWQPRQRGFRMAVIQPPGHIIHMTGQVAWNEAEEIVGSGDITAQTERCFDNIECILNACGGALQDIVSLTTYYTRRDQLPAIQAVRARRLASATLVSTSVMVAGLGHSDFLVELTPIAVVPNDRFRSPA